MMLPSQELNRDAIIDCTLPQDVEESLLECLVFKPIVLSDEKEIR